MSVFIRVSDIVLERHSMSTPLHKTALTWVSGKNVPGNTLQRHRSIAQEASRKEDLAFIADFVCNHGKFSKILIRLFMETNGMYDNIFEQYPTGCARTWENVTSHSRRNAIIHFDICTCTMRGTPELLALAKSSYEKQKSAQGHPTKTFSHEHIRKYMFTKRYVSSLIRQDLDKFYSQSTKSRIESCQLPSVSAPTNSSKKRKHGIKSEA